MLFYTDIDDALRFVDERTNDRKQESSSKNKHKLELTEQLEESRSTDINNQLF
jgi:hypothetical protein